MRITCCVCSPCAMFRLLRASRVLTRATRAAFASWEKQGPARANSRNQIARLGAHGVNPHTKLVRACACKAPDAGNSPLLAFGNQVTPKQSVLDGHFVLARRPDNSVFRKIDTISRPKGDFNDLIAISSGMTHFGEIATAGVITERLGLIDTAALAMRRSPHAAIAGTRSSVLPLWDGKPLSLRTSVRPSAWLLRNPPPRVSRLRRSRARNAASIGGELLAERLRPSVPVGA